MLLRLLVLRGHLLLLRHSSVLESVLKSLPVNYKHSFSSAACLQYKLIHTSSPRYNADQSNSCWANSRIVTIPNALTTVRIALTPFIAYQIVEEHFSSAVVALFFAGLTDTLDGAVARRWPSQQSLTGSYLDPLADKLLMTSLALSLSFKSLLPVSLTTLMIGRDVCILAGATYLARLSTRRSSVMVDKSKHGKITTPLEIKASLASKINTGCQVSTLWYSLLVPTLNIVDTNLLYGMWYLTAASTLVSGLDYLRQYPAYRRRALQHSHCQPKKEQPAKPC